MPANYHRKLGHFELRKLMSSFSSKHFSGKKPVEEINVSRKMLLTGKKIIERNFRGSPEKRFFFSLVSNNTMHNSRRVKSMAMFFLKKGMAPVKAKENALKVLNEIIAGLEKINASNIAAVSFLSKRASGINPEARKMFSFLPVFLEKAKSLKAEIKKINPERLRT